MNLRAGQGNYGAYFFCRVTPSKPSDIVNVPKIQNALDDVAGVLFGVDRFWVHIPKQLLPKAELR